jgi:hypothetical protein
MRAMLKRLPHLALILGLGVLVGSLLADTPPDTKKIAQLVEKLGSADFDEREQASQDLDKLGAPALEALKKAAQSDDAETRRRAADLVAKIEKREGSSLLLKPTRVTLALKDAPVADAIEALRKQTDFALQLNDPQNTLKDVRVTLDLKDVTFFDALAALCDKAGLVEGLAGQGNPGIRVQPPIKGRPVPPPGAPGAPGAPVPPAAPPEKGLAVPPQAAQPAQPAVPPVQALPAQRVQINPGGPIQVGAGQIVIGGAGGGWVGPGMPGMQAQPGTIVLTPGQAEKLPADTATAFRVRAVPNQFQIRLPNQNLLTATLEITPEPRLRWASHDSVSLTKIVDDQDQKLAQFDPNAAVPGPGGAPGGVPGFGGGIAFPMGIPGGFSGANATIPLFFKAGEKPTKSLKELTGTIAARVYVPHSKPTIFEKVMDAPGKSVKGEKGGEITILETTREAEAIRIKFAIAPAKDAVGGENQNQPQFPGGPFGGPGGIVPVPGPVPLPAPNPNPAPRPERPGFGFQVQAGQAQAGQAQAQPAQVLPIQAAPPGAAQIQIQIQPGPAIAAPIWGGPMMPGGMMPDIFRVLDEKGNSIAIASTQQYFTGGPAGMQRVTEIRVLQGKDAPKVASLSWQQMKTAAVDIPFTLKDVPVQ